MNEESVFDGVTLTPAEIDVLRKMRVWVFHAPTCRHALQTGPCSCWLLDAVPDGLNPNDQEGAD